MDELELAKSISAFLTLISAFHAGKDVSELVADFGSIRPLGGLNLVFFDSELNKLRAVDPRA
jgi:hypothetical protein